jgi:transposase
LIGSTPIDMRKSIDGLLAIVEQELQENAYTGHLFVFVSRRRDRVKILAWDKGGFVLSNASQCTPMHATSEGGQRCRHTQQARFGGRCAVTPTVRQVSLRRGCPGPR